MNVTTETTLRRRPRRALTALLVSLAVVLAGCSSGSSHATAETTQPATTAPATGTSTKTDAQLATEAYVWGYPLVVTERTLQLFGLATPVNHLRFQPTLSDASSRSVVAPNADTLYAIAPLDLRGGPLVLTVPAIHDRYYAFQFMSAYTDSFAYVGTRATGGEAGSWVITPPGWTGTLPAGAHRISAPTPQVVLLGRFLVDGKADVANVHALGTHISLQPLSTLTGTPAGAAPPPLGAPKGSAQAVARAGLGFYDELGDALAINPPVDAYERATVARFARLGIGPGRHPSTEVHDPAVRAALLAGITKGEAQLTAASGKAARSVDGWVVSTNAGSYGHDALTRAVVAKIGWGANIPVEAMYPHAVSDSTGGARSTVRTATSSTSPRVGCPPSRPSGRSPCTGPITSSCPTRSTASPSATAPRASSTAPAARSTSTSSTTRPPATRPTGCQPPPRARSTCRCASTCRSSRSSTSPTATRRSSAPAEAARQGASHPLRMMRHGR